MYPLVKLSLVAVSLVGLVTSSLALAGHTLAACSAHYPAYPGCWLGHPTPLLLAELSLMLTMSQVTHNPGGNNSDLMNVSSCRCC